MIKAPNLQIFSHSAFSHLFGGYFNYILQIVKRRVITPEEGEKKLYDLGYDMGGRLWEMFQLRERQQNVQNTRTNDHASHINVLTKITSKFWKFLFNKQLDKPEKTNQQQTNVKNQYYILDKSPITDKFISFPTPYHGISPSVFLGGLVHGALNQCNFTVDVKASTYAELQFACYIQITFNADETIKK